ncbi:MAG: hypothetical protein N2314_03000 [Brevinematales bacterium]|nr:hypothetical protein [Brevinematales bacterium]
MHIKSVGLLFLLTIGVGWASEPLSLVVMEIENRSGESSLDSRTLTEVIELHVVNMRRFRVVERQKLDRILTEQKLNQSGLTEKQVAQVGLLVGASKAIVGSLSRVGKNYLLLLRLIDTSTATIEEVAELREGSLEALLDRMDEPVRKLLRKTGEATSSQKTQGETSSQKTSEQPVASSQQQTKETSSDTTEETDESALERLVREAKEKLRQRQASQTPSETSSSPSDKEGSEEALAVSPKKEVDAVWKDLQNNRWGFVLQLGIAGDAQVYPRKWNFLGVGFGLFTLENQIYVGWEYAFLVPQAYLMVGYQQGLFPSVEGYLLGVQHGLINSVKISAMGWQAGFLNTVEENMLGVQQGFINVSGDLKGVQMGFINVAKEVRGVQVGFLNTAKSLYGVQLGFLNTSGKNGLPFMVGINIGW